MTGDKGRKFRNKKGLTQDAVARRVNVPYTTLTKIESEVAKKPSVQTVVKTAKMLGVSMKN